MYVWRQRFIFHQSQFVISSEKCLETSLEIAVFNLRFNSPQTRSDFIPLHLAQHLVFPTSAGALNDQASVCFYGLPDGDSIRLWIIDPTFPNKLLFYVQSISTGSFSQILIDFSVFFENVALYQIEVK